MTEREYREMVEARRKVLYEAKVAAGKNGVSDAQLRRLLPMDGMPESQRNARMAVNPGRPRKGAT